MSARLRVVAPSAASRIRLLRLRGPLKQRELAAFLGVSATTISAWECERSSPSRLARIRLAEYEAGRIRKPVEIVWTWR